MNKERRKAIKDVKEDLEKVINKLNAIRDDEEYAFDSMPEGLQASLRGEESEEAIDTMQEVLDLLDEANDKLDNII